MKKTFCNRFRPRDYELLMILFRFITGMGWYDTNIRHEDLYGDKEPWELYRWDSHEKYHYFFTHLKRKSKSKSASRFDRTVGKNHGTWHGQDKGKPIIDKKTGARLGYKRSFRYQNKQEPEQDRQWLLKEFYLNETVIMKARETYSILEHTKDFVICRLQRKKRKDEPQEIKDVPIETILQILMQDAADDSTATETLPPPPPTEEILALPAGVLQQSVQGENNNGGDDDDDMGLLLLDGGILNEDPELLAIQQPLLEDDDNCNDNRSYFEGFITEEILQEPASPLGSTIYAGQGGKCLSY